VRESAEPLNDTAVLLLISQMRPQPHFGKEFQALLMHDRGLAAHEGHVQECFLVRRQFESCLVADSFLCQHQRLRVTLERCSSAPVNEATRRHSKLTAVLIKVAEETIAANAKALEKAGIEFIAENGGGGRRPVGAKFEGNGVFFE
jgi:hypothetical protein